MNIKCKWRELMLAAGIGCIAAVAQGQILIGAAILSKRGGNVSPQEVTAITKEAWLYAYAPLTAYEALYNQTQNAADPAYAGGFNRFKHLAVDAPQAGSETSSGQSKTALSWAWLDLHNEPVVLTLPAEPSRSYVNQWFDLYTHNFANTGSETTGREAGNYLFTGPSWKGETPKGITRVFQSETAFVGTLTRVQSPGAEDASALKTFQSGLKLQPLSVYAGGRAPTAKASTLLLWDQDKARSVSFVGYLNALLPFMPIVASEAEMMTRFAKVGIGAGKAFDADKLKPEIRQAMEQGISQAQAELQANALPQGDYGAWFGSREFLGTDYVKKRNTAALLGPQKNPNGLGINTNSQ